MNNICYFCHELVESEDRIWIMEGDETHAIKIKQVLRCPQCDKQKESVVARIIGELKELDLSVKRNESHFLAGLRVSYEVSMKIQKWLDLLYEEEI